MTNINICGKEQFEFSDTLQKLSYKKLKKYGEYIFYLLTGCSKLLYLKLMVPKEKYDNKKIITIYKYIKEFVERKKFF